jgi:hypothetical protein
MNETCTSIGNLSPLMKKTREVRLRRVENGFIFYPEGDYGRMMIANTLAEALELARKEME